VHGEIAYDGKRLAGMFPHQQLKVAETAGVDIFGPVVGTKSGSVEDIPTHMDELDDLEEIYFGKTKINNEIEKAQLKGLYEYCWMLKPPRLPSIHVPYNLLLKLARVAPKDSETEFIKTKLKEIKETRLDSQVILYMLYQNNKKLEVFN
jgi:lysyl-tRNA synthetase class I